MYGGPRARLRWPPVEDSCDVLVIGGGHAGAEAAWAAAGVLGPQGRVVLVTMDPQRVGAMSCNPAIGGLAKGQMVREIDALGGLMGRAADATGIQFRMLNTSKGAAVRGPRAQCDKLAYAREVQRLLGTRPGIRVVAGMVERLETESAPHLPGGLQAAGAVLAGGAGVRARAVVVTTGTFMRALMHTGERRTPGGRVGEGSAVGISASLSALGLELGRLKTGTPPRLARESIDWEGLRPQHGDRPPTPFSEMTPAWLEGGRFPRLPQVECRETATTPEIHELIRANLHRAPMYTGQVDAECGPRYCPSIEDKVTRFAERPSHHVFLEPESLESGDIYCNGISTSLPEEVQERIVHGMPGCERARVVRWGYAVEYDMVWPHQIDATGEVKRVPGLFLAGQINGTSGYEEAAGQGLVAGLNAARRVLGAAPRRLERHEAYLGVMMDDLVTRTPREPYRMFTSRAEHRLLLRADNAPQRLTPLGRELGLVCAARWEAFECGQRMAADLAGRLARLRLDGRPAAEWMRRPDLELDRLREALGVPEGGPEARHLDVLVNDARYAGYVERQDVEIRRQRQAEDVQIPEELQPASITGLRREAVEVLERHRPRTLGQASRLAGVNPADLMLVSIAIRRRRRVR